MRTYPHSGPSFPGLPHSCSSVCVQYNTRKRKNKTGEAWERGLVRTLIVSNVNASIALEENLQDKILAGGELLLHTALINMAPDDGVSWEGVRESLVQRVRHEFHKLCSEGHGGWDGEVGI